MAKANPETIILKGDPIMSEGAAGGVITPGSLVRRLNATIVVQNLDAVGAPPSFAKENDIAGDGIEHPYASAETVLFFTAYGGMVVNARLKSGENIDIGEGLISGADGLLKAAGSAVPIGISLEDTGGTTTAIQHLKVEIV